MDLQCQKHYSCDFCNVTLPNWPAEGRVRFFFCSEACFISWRLKYYNLFFYNDCYFFFMFDNKTCVKITKNSIEKWSLSTG